MTTISVFFKLASIKCRRFTLQLIELKRGSGSPSHSMTSRSLALMSRLQTKAKLRMSPTFNSPKVVQGLAAIVDRPTFASAVGADGQEGEFV